MKWLTSANDKHKMQTLDISYYFINITFCGKSWPFLIHLSFFERSQNLIDLVGLNLSQVMSIPELNEYCKSESLRMFWIRSTTVGSSKGLAEDEKNRLVQSRGSPSICFLPAVFMVCNVIKVMDFKREFCHIKYGRRNRTSCTLTSRTVMYNPHINTKDMQEDLGVYEKEKNVKKTSQ